MLTTQEIATVYKYVLELPVSEERKLLMDLLIEYCKYSRSGTPEECAQRKELMSMSYEDIMCKFNSIARNSRLELMKKCLEN